MVSYFLQFLKWISNQNYSLHSAGIRLYSYAIFWKSVNPLTAKLVNWNFHPPEVVSRWRDPQLQVSEKYSDLIDVT